ncbi:MAG TPA: fibrobacter succinogenes major paralogous domain-containing protein [Bacteroidales bacterium]|nr:fibrobacter succinogenes major paralogous domain-containing protein [Bacteroidales bacterium]HPR10738.1 fibrobacter succinogenes major paralogous domain-containing protein [Bacteroidales bacterium]
MKTKLAFFTLILALSPVPMALSQTPQGFNYQAIARDASGEPIINTPMPVRITIQADSLGTIVIWQELHSTVTTNNFGLIPLVIGRGARQAASTVENFSDIDWDSSPVFIKTEIDYLGWKTMGVSRLWSVPYALMADDLSGSIKKLTIEGETPVPEEALFEVKNKNGQTVFAVYNEGVRIYVSDGDEKGLKGGFAVGGFGTDKAESTRYLFIGRDSVRIFLDTNPLTKKQKGGFAVGGYDLTKGTAQDYFNVSADSVRIYIDSDPEAKKLKGGFAVGGFDATKTAGLNYMEIKPDSSNFYVRKLTPEVSSTFNIIGIEQNLTRRSLMRAATDTIGISGVLDIFNDLLVRGDIAVSGTINVDTFKVTDTDGNVYRTVLIGTQEWMGENLKTTRYNDGTVIPLVADSVTWRTIVTPAFCYYNNNAENTEQNYGALYNWYAVNTGKLCPSGWHIPSNSDWSVLTDYLGGESVAGGKLKETGTVHWTSPNTDATDEVKFTGLPGGARGATSIFDNMGRYGYWWTADGHSVDPLYAWGFVLSYISAEVIRADYYYKRDGFSVRCVRD